MSNNDPPLALSPTQEKAFAERGVLVVPSLVDQPELDELQRALADEMAIDSPRRVLEKDGKTVRSVYGSHLHDERFRRLGEHPALVRVAEQLLGHEVYVYQFKINIKAAFGGDLWEWHQDYIYWSREDGLPRPDVVTFAVCLDDVNEFNGPLFVVPGSHNLGLIAPLENAPVHNDRRQPYSNQPAWIANLVANIKYSIDQPTLEELVKRLGLESLRGPRGSALLFHSNIVHSSPANLSPYRRAIALISYCRTDNVPRLPADARPPFLVARDYSPVRARRD